VGLGLFVAEGLVRTAGCRLTATNRAAGGAHFHLELPAAGTDTATSTDTAAAAGPSLAPTLLNGGSLPEVR
jgi:hypothetical protein